MAALGSPVRLLDVSHGVARHGTHETRRQGTLADLEQGCISRRNSTPDHHTSVHSGVGRPRPCLYPALDYLAARVGARVPSRYFCVLRFLEFYIECVDTAIAVLFYDKVADDWIKTGITVQVRIPSASSSVPGVGRYPTV